VKEKEATRGKRKEISMQRVLLEAITHATMNIKMKSVNRYTFVQVNMHEYVT
jgi:hypothetical protein